MEGQRSNLGEAIEPAATRDPERVLDFWFGKLNELGRADEAFSSRWFKKDPKFDQAIRDEFGRWHAEVAAGRHDGWAETPRGRLALVLVLDQFSRNLFRGTPRAFGNDERALTLSTEGIQRGHDRALRYEERVFLYMPYMHSEDLAIQEQSVELFRALRDEVSEAFRESANSVVDFAERHRDIVRRFGRFPHRNTLLDRTSTAEEIQFLREPGSSF